MLPERSQPRRSVLIAAGGTGGHLFPGIAVADELRRRDATRRVLFVGTQRGLESRLVPRAGYPLELLPILPLNGVGPLRAVLGVLALPWALLRAAALLLRERPAAVLGVGGYAGGPLVLIAALVGVRTVLLEPNAHPGFTNRVLRPFVVCAACAYPPAVEFFGAKARLTGNPVRADFVALPSPPEGARSVLVFGGSQGSQVLNRAMVAALSELPRTVRIVHQTGPAMFEQVRAAYLNAGRTDEVQPFLDDMPQRFAAASLIVSRSGATTCAELAVAGRPALLIPFAAAADDHQRKNAAALQAAGAATTLEESQLSGATMAREISALIGDPRRLAAMSRAARAVGRPDAAARVADLLEASPSPQPSPGGRGSHVDGPALV